MQTKNRLALIVLTLLLAVGLKAQDLQPGFKTWGGTGLNLRFSPRTTVRISQLTAFNTVPHRFQFLQSNLSLGRKIGERWNLDVGYARSWFQREESLATFNRFFAEVDYKSTLGPFNVKQSVRSEWHFPQLRKYRYRLIYTNKLSLRFKKLPLRPQPFLRQQLYWYLGGRNVRYYEFEDEELEEPGELLVEQPANGLHRYRLSMGVRMRLARRFYGTVYYTWQREFNTPFFPERHLNVPNRKGTRTQAPFNNYSLIGLSLSYTLKLYD